MLTEQFINLCCAISTDKDKHFPEIIHRSIGQVLNFTPETEVPLPFKTKFEFAKTINRLRIEGNEPDFAIDSILTTGKYSQIENFIVPMSERVFPKDRVKAATDQIISKKRYISILKDLPRIEDYAKKMASSDFTDAPDAIQEWSRLITEINSSILDEKRKESNSNIKELDLFCDDFNAVLDQIKVNYSGENCIPTGYKILDEYMGGGAQPGRLYIFGGSSGDGKSVLLNNFVRNAVDAKVNPIDDKMNIYIYFTCENLIDESFARLHCCNEGLTVDKFLRDIDKNRDELQASYKQWQLDSNSVVVMAYLPPFLTTVSDIMSYVDLVKQRYEGRGVVRSIYVDYLDVLKSGQTFDLYRLELGQVTMDLKVAAVLMQIPIVTVTQLNRGGYNQKEQLSLGLIGESIKKVEHADFVALLRAMVNEEEENKYIGNQQEPDLAQMLIAILKNRSGPKNRTITLETNFSQFRINDMAKTTTPAFELPKKEVMEFGI